MTEQSISLERLEETINVFGSFDENIRIIEGEMEVSVVSRDSMLKVSGENAENVMYAVKAIEALMSLSSRGEAINEQNVRYIIQLVRSGNERQISQLAGDVLCVTAKGRPIKAKTLGQKKYVEAIKKNVVTLGIGPAGTGKTYLAVAMAVSAFRAKEVNRIILTRPAVEAGESWASSPATCSPRWIPISARCTTLCSTCWAPRPIKNTWSGAISKSRLWRICAGAPWTTPSLFWTRRRTPRPSR